MKTEDQDSTELFRRIAKATERTASNTLWAALPMWIIIVLYVWVGLVKPLVW
jgi:hypothetical protein